MRWILTVTSQIDLLNSPADAIGSVAPLHADARLGNRRAGGDHAK